MESLCCIGSDTFLTGIIFFIYVVVILGSDHRFGVANFPDACREKGMSVIVDENILIANDTSGEYEEETQQQLLDSLELGGYNQRACTTGHDFTMFTINKPITTTA